MAFNPFDVFRRNQKILFGILTVFIMIMFTLSFGQGDFFTTIQNYVGTKTRKGETLALIDGSKFTESELAEINRRRELANVYMSNLQFRALQNTQQYVRDGLSRVSGEKKQTIQGALDSIGMLQQLGGNPQFLQFVVQRMQQVSMQLDGILADKNSPKQTDLDMAQSAKTLLLMVQRQMFSNPRLYFDNQPNTTSREQVEFALWQRKADKLGIYLSDVDVAQLILSEFNSRIDNKDLAEAEQPLKGRGTVYKPSELRAALAEEFRVRAAQLVVLGQGLLRAGDNSFQPPYDYFNYFKQQTSPAHYGFISLPAEAFISQVTATPTESQLQKLFNEARNIEPNPADTRPALREPRRLKLEWIETRGDEPFYKNLSTSLLPQVELQSRLAFAVGLPLGFPTIASTISALAPLGESDLALQAKYRTYKSNHESMVSSNWFSTPFLGAKPLDTDIVRTQQMASLVVSFANSGVTFSGPFGPAALLVGEAYHNSRKARALTIPAITLAPVLPGSFAPSILTTLASQSRAIEPLPLSAVRATLTEETQTELAKKTAESDIKKFGEEILKLGAKDDKKEVKDYIAKTVKERGWKLGQSTDFRDMYTIDNDPGLIPLKDKFMELVLQASRPGVSPYAPPGTFGRFFFEEPAGERGRSKPSEGLYKIDRFPTGSTLPSFQVWRSEEQPGETLKDIRNPIVRAKVEQLWKKLEARKLAKQAAEDLAKQTGSLGKSFIEIEMKLRDKSAELASKFNAAGPRPQYFEMTNVAPLVAPEFAALSAGDNGLNPFQMSASANITYPNQKMLKALLDTKDKALSTSTVLVDTPEDTYYVAVLMNRQDKTVQSFAELTYGSGIQSLMARRTVEQFHQADLRKQARDAAVALLKAEFGYDKENADLLEKSRSSSDLE
jgi:hypothetical protein